MDPDITPQLAALYDRYLQERAERDPNWATMVGIHDHDRLLTRFDDASHDARVKFVDTWLEKVPDGTPQRHDGQGCLLPGDSLDATTKLKEVYAKTGRSGKMVFAVWETAFTNQNGIRVALVNESFVRRNVPQSRPTEG